MKQYFYVAAIFGLIWEIWNNSSSLQIDIQSAAATCPNQDLGIKNPMLPVQHYCFVPFLKLDYSLRS